MPRCLLLDHRLEDKIKGVVYHMMLVNSTGVAS